MQILLALALSLPAFRLAPNDGEPSAVRTVLAQDPAALRAEGPPALERLLALYDRLSPGADRDALERMIDAVAMQRHAASSRLYWYTDLAAAETAARESGRPILSLRMLGRLDDELSCANSRLFRVVLYADGELSRFLRENFVLHWSSERPVPRVTIDFGDGRRIETTIAGNSAHFVLDAGGRPLDVLPGVYSARAFRRELEVWLPLALESPGLSANERARRVRELHRERSSASTQLWTESGPPVRVTIASGPGIVAAEKRTIGKAVAEWSTIRALRLDPALAVAPANPSPVPLPTVPGPADSTSAVSTAGFSTNELWVRRLEEARLDASSRALATRLEPTDWTIDARPLTGSALERRMQLLEALVAADTEANETKLHAIVHSWFDTLAELPTFAQLDERVYRELFLTGSDDAWLGLSNAGAFNALPHDGIVK